jgi:hypothetical protein
VPGDEQKKQTLLFTTEICGDARSLIANLLKRATRIGCLLSDELWFDRLKWNARLPAAHSQSKRC